MRKNCRKPSVLRLVGGLRGRRLMRTKIFFKWLPGRNFRERCFVLARWHESTHLRRTTGRGPCPACPLILHVQQVYRGNFNALAFFSFKALLEIQHSSCVGSAVFSIRLFTRLLFIRLQLFGLQPVHRRSQGRPMGLSTPKFLAFLGRFVL